MISKPFAKILFVLLIIGAFILTGLGGYLDITNQPRLWIMSKEHLWNDGLFMLTASTLLLYVLYQ